MRRSVLPLVLAAAAALAPVPARGQVLADPVLRGQVLLSDSVLRRGTVVLHRVATEAQGEVDSVAVSRDGTFSFRLPTVPDPERSEVYFASVRHAGVLYFGKAVTLAVQLDSLYEIQAYDTAMAPPGGLEVAVQARNVFLEAGDGGRWVVTELFQLRNDQGRTLVAQEGDVVWRHPLPAAAVEATSVEADFSGAGAEVREDALVVASPLPPGERVFIVRYTADDPFLALPVASPTEVLEVMIQEPAPRMEVAGLERVTPVEMEEGVTFQRLIGTDVAPGTLRFVEGDEPSAPPVQWFAVLLALVLAGFGGWAAQRGGGLPRTPREPELPSDRRALIVEIARLDEAFEAGGDPTPEERGAYEARRRALLRRLIQLG